MFVLLRYTMLYAVAVYWTSTFTQCLLATPSSPATTPGAAGCIFHPSAVPARTIASRTSSVLADLPGVARTTSPLTLLIGRLVHAAVNASRVAMSSALVGMALLPSL